MFKNKKVSLIVFSTLALILAVGFVAFTPTDIASAAEAVFQHGPGGRGGRDGQKGPGFGSENTFLADALGITAEELQTAYEAARTSFEGRVDKEEMNAAVAEALGITVEELDAAREVAKDAALKQALADGKITEEQVAMMEARTALKNYLEKDEILAKVLGITVAELEAAKEDGQRIPDLLVELGIDEETFQADMQAAHEAALQQAVEDGVITQEQADLILENGFGGPKGPGGNKDPGGHGRGGRGRSGGSSSQPQFSPENDG